MSGNEIKEKIDEINQQIQILAEKHAALFTLNPEVRKLQEEITSLQAQCVHTYHDGFCIYCGKEHS